MQESQQIATRSFIEQLCSLRNGLITSQLQSLLQTKLAFALCQQIDNSVTPSEGCLIDSATSALSAIQTALGEYARGSIRVKAVNLTQRTDDELAAVVTCSVDGVLWQLLFNRLNIYQLMNAPARELFVKTCQTTPQPFTPDHVQATLEDIYNNRDAMMLDSLMDAVVKSDPAYASNSRFAFNRKIVFKDALSQSMTGSYTIEDRSLFRDSLRFLSCFVFADDVHVDMDQHKGIARDFLYAQVRDALKQNGGNPARLKIDMGPGHGYIELFKNGNAHILFEDQLRNYLNDLLAQTKTLACA